MRRAVLVGPLFGPVLKAPDDPLKRSILRAVALRPGIGPAQLCRVVDANRSTLDDALYRLVKAGHLQDQADGRNHAYFLPDVATGATHALRGGALRVLNAVLETDGRSFSDLATRLGMSPSEVTRVAAELDEAGLVVKVKDGGRLFLLPGNGAQP